MLCAQATATAGGLITIKHGNDILGHVHNVTGAVTRAVRGVGDDVPGILPNNPRVGEVDNVELPFTEGANITPRSAAVLSQTDVARLNRIRSNIDITSNRQLRRNVAFGEGHVDGVDLGEVIGVSGARGPGVDIPVDRIFQTGIDGHPRHLDSEVLVLENIARILTPQSTGNIRLISERTVCNSCEGVINQFREMFPNINLVVRAGE